jgi:hypothetical protein
MCGRAGSPIALVEISIHAPRASSALKQRGKIQFCILSESSAIGKLFAMSWYAVTEKVLAWDLSRKTIYLLSARVRWHQVVCTIVDHKLAIVLAAMLDGERPDGGVVGHSIAEKLRSLVQSRVALLLNHFRSGGDGLLHELDDVGFGLESVTRRIVALAEVGPDV